MIADVLDEQRAWLDVVGVLGAVDGDGDVHGKTPMSFSLYRSG